MNVEYKIISAPVYEEFYDWYPYIKDENLAGESPLWKKHLNNALINMQEGMKSLYITAKDKDSNRYVGVVWLNYPAEYPKIVHLGWFFIEPDYRGMGIGKNIMDICEQWEIENNIEVIMLPTSINLMAYSNIYLKRGWKDTITDPETGYTFMAKELTNGFYNSYSNATGYCEFDDIRYKDFIPLDFLANRVEYFSRLYPVNAYGMKRFLSYEQDWSDIDTCVLRCDGMLKGIAVYSGSDIDIIDIIAYGHENMDKTLKGALKRWSGYKSLMAFVHKSDMDKLRIFADCGFKELNQEGNYILTEYC